MIAVEYVFSLSVSWPITFYVHGLLGLIWVASWYFNGASTPAEHSYISKEEIDYIEYSIGLEKDKRQKVNISVIILNFFRKYKFNKKMMFYSRINLEYHGKPY